MSKEKRPDRHMGPNTIDLPDMPEWMLGVDKGIGRIDFEDSYSEDGPIEELRPLLSYLLMAIIKGNPIQDGKSDEARLADALSALVGSRSSAALPRAMTMTFSSRLPKLNSSNDMMSMMADRSRKLSRILLGPVTLSS